MPQPYVDIFVIRDYNCDAPTNNIKINQMTSFEGLYLIISQHYWVYISFARFLNS